MKSKSTQTKFHLQDSAGKVQKNLTGITSSNPFNKLGTKIWALLLIFIFSGTVIQAAIRTSTATGGSWGTGSTWVGGTVPAATDQVVIATTGTNSVTGSVTGSTYVCAGLTINAGSILTMQRDFTVNGPTSISGTINFGSTSFTQRTMALNGAVTLNSGSVWNETTTGQAADFTFSNSFTNNAATFTAQNTAHGFSGSGMTIGGGTAIVLPTVTFTGNYTNSGTLTVSTLLTVTGAAIRLTNNGTITAAAALSGTGGVTQGITGVLNLGGTSGISTLTATAVGNTVNYTGAAQAVKATAYNILSFSGSSAKTISTGTSVAGKLSITGVTANVGTGLSITVGSLTLGGLNRINGTWGSTSSAATNTNNTFFAATNGVLNVTNDTRPTSTITWANPADITYGTALGATQLNASATPAGSFLYTPVSGTVLKAGLLQNLQADFTPTDLTSYKTALLIVQINVNKADLPVTGLTAAGKVYDATTTASFLGTPAVTPVTGDIVVVDGTASGTFDTKDVGTLKPVTVTGVTISGADAGNYNLIQPTGLTADITQADLTVEGLTTSAKIYDATTDAILGGTAAVIPLGTDDVVAGGTAAGTFSDKNVGTAKEVTVTGVTISGADAGNYNLLQQSGLTADIMKADMTVTGLTTSNKVYDATTDALLGGTAAVTPLSTDIVQADGPAVGTFADKNVGTAKIVTVTGVTISGADAGNYNLIQQADLTADITPADLIVSGLTTSNKVYDATIDATINGTLAVTALGTDVVVVEGTGAGSFADKNVGTSKPVTIAGITISGADAGNYNLIQQTGLSADITKADLSVSGLTATGKEYDATTDSFIAGIATVTPLIADDVTAGGTATGTFADKNAGTAIAVTVTGITISGTDAGNYNLLQQTGLIADITPRNIVITPDAGQGKNAGTADPLLTYTFAPALFVPDAITGSLGRVAGETVGTYAFTLTDLTAGSNYALIMTATPSTFLISAATGIEDIKLNSGLLLKNYPNPFIENTTISYTLPVDGRVTLTIRNLAGQVVKTILNEMETSGDYTMNIEAGDLKSGIYLGTLKLNHNGKYITKTIRIIKGN